MKNTNAQFINLGLTDYKTAWDYQTNLFDDTIMLKKHNRDMVDEEPLETANYLVFCEHPPVYTQGKSGKESNLLITEERLKEIGATYYHINRGGDITFHGPGQLVGYPIFDLENFFTDIHRYLRTLEEAVILTLKEFDIQGGRIKGLTGVWIDADDPLRARKICALGVKSSRWVTMHGFALNVNTDLSYFDHIVPCGIRDKAVTSMKNETGNTYDMYAISESLRLNIARLFEINFSEPVYLDSKSH